jgi:hypothetical protein
MSISTIITGLPEKKLNLLKNIVSVGVVLTILYAVLTLVTLSNFMLFFSNSAFLISVCSLVGLGVVWKILNGAELVIPKQPMQQKSNTTFGSWSKPPSNGSWKCSRCGTFVIGNICDKCGAKRK